MKFVLNSLTYHNCPVTEREKAAFTADERHALLKRIHAKPGINEVAILETCNRLEFYAYAKKEFDVTGYLSEIVAEVRPAALESWNKYKEVRLGTDVIRHLFEVTAGLDSQMLGENQIVSQVKSAYRESTDYKTSRFVFHRLFHIAFRVSKTVRTQTKINMGAVSISQAAVHLAKGKIDLAESTAAVLGAGENAELACKHLIEAGVKKLVLVNRTKEKARDLADRLNISNAVDFNGLHCILSDIDFIIGSTASLQPVFTYQQFWDVLKDRQNPLLIIDIAVPRDIEDQVANFNSVTLFNIDDLDRQISVNKKKRNKEIPKATKIVEQFTQDFDRWYQSLEVVPVIARLTKQGTDLAQQEAKRYAKDFCPEELETLTTFAESIVKKMLHGPINFLKTADDEELSGEQFHAVDLLNKMFFSEKEKQQ
ncbi:MAG: glutamyl-tRNA reductase [Planctomycetota bacterium]|jgi:glutamyl-tRNA reductase